MNPEVAAVSKAMEELDFKKEEEKKEEIPPSEKKKIKVVEPESDDDDYGIVTVTDLRAKKKK
jgi:hypothetical protein